MEGGKDSASAMSESITRQAEAPGSQKSTEHTTRVVPKGFGRIVRDGEGNVVDVEMDEDEGDDESPSVDDRGGLVEDRASVIAPEAARWVTGAQQHPDTRTDVVQGKHDVRFSLLEISC